jgi:hypothetical protein
MGKWWRNQVVGAWHVLIDRAHACYCREETDPEWWMKWNKGKARVNRDNVNRRKPP